MTITNKQMESEMPSFDVDVAMYTRLCGTVRVDAKDRAEAETKALEYVKDGNDVEWDPDHDFYDEPIVCNIEEATKTKLEELAQQFEKDPESLSQTYRNQALESWENEEINDEQLLAILHRIKNS